MVPQPRRSEGADRTLAAVLQRAAAAQRPWLQPPGDRSPELVGTRYHSPRTHCLIGYKFHTQVSGRRWRSCAPPPAIVARSVPCPPDAAPARAWPVRSPLFSQGVLDHVVLEHLLGQQLLQPGVLRL